MNLQEIFDKVTEHLLTQKKKAERPNPYYPDSKPHCAYRGSDGTSCAVGCLIPDEHYTADMEGGGVWRADVVKGLFNAGVLSVDSTYNVFGEDRTKLDLLERLQTVHDNYEPSAWAFRLYTLSKQFQLTWDERWGRFTHEPE
jgi:hypothetical protein